MNDAPLAQLVEQRTVNPFVAGSSPAGGAKETVQKEWSVSFFFNIVFTLNLPFLRL